VLIVAVRTTGGATYPGMIAEMDSELSKVIHDFERAMNFEALRLANDNSKLSFSQLVDN